MSASVVSGIDNPPNSQAARQGAASLANRLRLKLIVAHPAEASHIPAVLIVPHGATERLSGVSR